MDLVSNRNKPAVCSAQMTEHDHLQLLTLIRGEEGTASELKQSHNALASDTVIVCWPNSDCDQVSNFLIVVVFGLDTRRTFLWRKGFLAQSHRFTDEFNDLLLTCSTTEVAETASEQLNRRGHR